jgi:G:T-mismatch repair DNA endonuclease (very short patch repair protein)
MRVPNHPHYLLGGRKMAILEEETYKKFGYYTKDLSQGSHKLVMVCCDECLAIRIVVYKQYKPLCRSCSHKGERNFNHGKVGSKNPNWLEREKCVCKECGKEFELLPSRIYAGRGLFCSYTCHAMWTSKNRSREKSPRWTREKCVCSVCGTVFFRKQSEILKAKKNYCSNSCVLKRVKQRTHHTKPERIFEDICKKQGLPFKYTGNGTFWIHNINPDFVECNGKKIAVEVFGDYWHSPLLNYRLREDRTLSYRKKLLKKYGWKLIVFWETDLLREDAEAFVLKSLNRSKLFNNKESILEYI